MEGRLNKLNKKTRRLTCASSVVTRRTELGKRTSPRHSRASCKLLKQNSGSWRRSSAKECAIEDDSQSKEKSNVSLRLGGFESNHMTDTAYKDFVRFDPGTI